MKEVNIRLSDIASIRNFVGAVLGFDYEIDLCSGRYTVDAKSIMGIFSLDLLHPIKLIAHTDNADALFEKIQPYIVK